VNKKQKAEAIENGNLDKFIAPLDTFDDWKAVNEALKAALAVQVSIVKQAVEDAKAFIWQIDHEGVGMQTVCDHRVRVDKFLKRLKSMGVE